MGTTVRVGRRTGTLPQGILATNACHTEKPYDKSPTWKVFALVAAEKTRF
jgi:hypothetical protein